MSSKSEGDDQVVSGQCESHLLLWLITADYGIASIPAISVYVLHRPVCGPSVYIPHVTRCYTGHDNTWHGKMGRDAEETGNSNIIHIITPIPLFWETWNKHI